MINRKRVRQKGKTGLSKAFRKYKEGDSVMLVGMPGSNSMPAHFRSKTCTVVGHEGKFPIVRFLNGKQVKKIVINPIYLKKLK